MNRLITSMYLLFINLFASAQTDSLYRVQRADVFNSLEEEHKENVNLGKTNFDRWQYSQKKHAFVGYYGLMFHYGFNDQTSSVNLNHTLGGFYKGKLVQHSNYELHLQAWVEQESLLAGESTKNFSSNLDMFSVVNGSDATGSEMAMEYLYFENYLFNKLFDITVGKIDPLFITTYTSYGGWDRMTFFSKTAASDPVLQLIRDLGFSRSEFQQIFQHRWIDDRCRF